MVLENRRREATRLASQITAHSGFSPRSRSHIGIENIVRRCLRSSSVSVKQMLRPANIDGLVVTVFSIVTNTRIEAENVPNFPTSRKLLL